jgi:hypothetical protein
VEILAHSQNFTGQKIKVLIGEVGCFCFPLDIVVAGKFKKITNFIKGSPPYILNPRILICGLPMRQGRIGIAQEPRVIIKAIYKGMEQIARQEQAGIIAFKDFDLSYRKILDDGFLKIDSLKSLLKFLTDTVQSGVTEHFQEVMARKNYTADDVLAGREYAEAYVKFVHYVEGIYEATKKTALAHPHESEEAGLHKD